MFGISKKKKKFFGLLPDKIDNRDFSYKVKVHIEDLPATTNRKNINAFLIRYDQGELGSCVGHGIVEAFRRILQVTDKPDFAPSRLFAYWISRIDKNNDTGATIRDAFKAMNRDGLCSEVIWPYKIDRFAETPPDEAFDQAQDHQSIRYERIYPVTKEAIMDAVSHGYPVVYGKNLYSSFMSDEVASSGIVPTPRRFCEKLYGGHCMVIFDYDQDGTIELNSWGNGWGQNGVCHVPWDYVLNPRFCRDFWVLYLTE